MGTKSDPRQFEDEVSRALEDKCFVMACIFRPPPSSQNSHWKLDFFFEDKFLIHEFISKLSSSSHPSQHQSRCFNFLWPVCTGASPSLPNLEIIAKPTGVSRFIFVLMTRRKTLNKIASCK